MRTTAELREGFQRFYEERGHLRVPSHSLIPPPDDPSTLFIVAGMQPFKPYFVGAKEPPRNRVVSVQKCLRAGGKDSDLEDVGRTDRHNSFFEMMGNFSFGDYFKDEAVDLAWEFVTGEMGLDPEKLWATVHEGDPLLELGEDTVAIEAWKRVGIPVERIVRLGKDNFWQAADTGPCGPCSEIFYDRGAEHGCGREECRPGCECDRYMEFYNLVFMEFDLRPGNELVRLPSQNVDTGLGVERGACVLQGAASNFDTDGFRLLMDWVAAESGVASGESELATKAQRVLADHARAMSFLIADGVTPSNEGRGYICRRIIRRAVQHGQRIGLDRVYRLPGARRRVDGRRVPELREHADEIERVVRAEEERFRETLARGLKVFEELAGQEAISAEDAFLLATTYGFPVELTQELAEERGQPVDIDRFRELMEEHREISRAGGEKSDLQRAADFARDAGFRTEFVGYEKTDVLTELAAVEELGDGLFLAKLRESPFYPDGGGQVTDAGELIHEETGAVATLRAAYRFGDDQALVFEGTGFAAGDRVRAVVPWQIRFPTMANHTATHLLQAALREVLGEHVKQAGSAVRPDKLRFDFTHPRQLSAEERERVERIVNEKVFEAIPVRTFVTTIDEARKLGAMMLFGEKYGEDVRVVEIDGFSRELCGGTHVRSTAEIGPFVITSEGSVGSGVAQDRGGHLRRGLGRPARALAGAGGRARRARAGTARGQAAEGRGKAGRRRARDRRRQRHERDRDGGRRRGFRGAPRPLRPLQAAELAGRDRARLARERDGEPGRQLRPGRRRAALGGDVVKEIAPIVGGGGGGRPTMARAGGKQPEHLADALARARELITAALQ